MQKTYETDWLYRLWRPWVWFSIRHAFRSLTYLNRENIPTDGAVIFAPNHTNALMDALLILALNDTPKVFVARADIFRNKRLARILNWLKIMPIMRIRDGISEVRKNDETITNAVDAMLHGMPFVIFPEGTHRPLHNALLPLGKGIFRIALMANEQLHQPVYIVPTGIVYRDFFHLHDHVTVRFGEPINVTEYARNFYSQSPASDVASAHPSPILINRLRDELSRRMLSLISYNPDSDATHNPAFRVVSLLLTSPLAAACALITLPHQIIKLIIRHKVEDKCFCNSIEFVCQMLASHLSLGLLFLPIKAIEEWLYQWRQITHSNHITE